MAHVVGFTNVEDIGQEGIELASQDVLAGSKGSRRVIKDRLGHIVEDIRAIREPMDGKDLVLSIDSMDVKSYTMPMQIIQHILNFNILHR